MAVDRTAWFQDLIRVEIRLYNAVDQRLQAEHDVTLGTVQLMMIMRRLGSCRVYDLVREIGITVGAMSKSVDRLETAGFCRRSANPGDRRSSLISLTAAGEAKLDAAEPVLDDEVRARTVGLSDRQVQQMATTLASLRSALEQDQS
jgi:DNA-binding MarR family transcriptional regulator